MNRQIFRKLCLLLAYLNHPAFALANDNTEFPDFEWRGLLDLRYAHADGLDNWLDGRLGKFNDGNGNNANNFLALNQAALSLKARLDWNWSSSVTAKYAGPQNNPLDIQEALLMFKPVSTAPLRVSARAGAFFPPVSLENSGTAWTSPYTLSNSAINSWVGEELKIFGGEAQLQYHFNGGDRIGLFAAGFGNNDTAGVLLAWRGWNLSDYTATLNDGYRVPSSVDLPALFPKQANVSQPFTEVDNRPGFYTGFSVERPEVLKFRAMYYDNRGQPNVVKNGQYAWHTRFGNLGLKLQLPWQIDLISQAMLGETQMGNKVNGQYAVDASFWSASLLLSKQYRQHRFSARYDRFAVSGFDYLPQDPHAENGDALTCNYNITLFQQHQLNFEMTHIDSNRAARLNLGQAAMQEQTLWQVAYRLFF